MRCFVKLTDIPTNWSAGKAWICVASLFAMQVGLALTATLFSHLVVGYPLNRQPIASFLLNATAGLLAVFITLVFARPRTLEQFRSSFGLKNPKLQTALASIGVGTIFGGVAVLAIIKGFGSPRNHLVESFSTSGSTGLILLRFLLILVPFIEEFIVRGYLYPAFRQSYSVIFSVISIVAIALVNHFAPVTSSLVAALAVIFLNIVLCLIREKTNNLWNCVLCHLAYNLVCALS